MNRELLLQALDKFEKLWEIGIDVEYKVELLPEIRALREELAKPQNEFHPDWDTLQPYHDRIAELEAQLALYKKADNARELGLDYEPEQEPVKKALRLKPHECICGYSVGHPLVPKCICKPEYTAPPKREWQGLTDEDIEDAADYDILVFVRAIEAKLREKNEST